ncbi:transporter substrate-binding domain-containing protein [Pseudomonas sp. CAU 1711]|uniref:substrate-binding periplasmic protein n=1 Tax=Pseudomonas sp. CAU 1711 TaxID=3140356 RepID=UPI0032600D43
MRKTSLLKTLSLLALFPLWGEAAGKCETLVATGNPQSAPYLWRDPQSPKHLIGANADLLMLIGEQLGLKVEMLYMGDGKQALAEVHSGRVDLLAGATLDVERLESMDYVHPAFFTLSTQVWVGKDQGFPYVGWEDLRERKGGVMQGARLAPQFVAFARDNLVLEKETARLQAFQKLLLGRTDYLLHERHTGLALAETQGMLSSLEILEPPVSSEGLYLALSHNSACNDPWLRGQLAKKMTELSASGVPESLLQRNLERWKTQQAESADIPSQEQE